MPNPRNPRPGSTRKVVFSALIAFLVIGTAIFLWSRRQSRNAASDDSAGAAFSAATATQDSARLTSKKAEPAPDAKKVEPEAVAEEAPPPTAAPLLHGKVTGDGAGIEGASIVLFSTKGIESFIDRMESLAPDAGEMPDFEPIIAGVREELERFRKSGVTAKTDKEGKYEFRGIEPTSYFVLTVAEGWLFHYGDIVSLAADRDETLDVAMDHGASISGRVINASGGGIAGAIVIAEFRPANMAGVGLIVRRLLRYLNGEFLKGPFQTATREDGSFTVASLPTGVYDVAAYKLEGVEARVSLIETGATDAVIYLGDPARVKARFTDAQGQAAAQVPVLLERKDDQVQLPLPMAGFDKVANTVNRFVSGGPKKATTGAKGEMLSGLLAPGKYKLLLEARGFMPLEREFELDWGQTLDLGVIQVDRGATLRGFVVAVGGAPLEHAKVLAAPANTNFMNMGGAINDFVTGRSSAWTDSKGEFRLKGLLKGPYRLTVTCAGYAPAQKKKVDSNGEPVTIELKPGVQVTGRVIRASDQSPIRDAKVRANSGPLSTRTDEDGRFVLEGVVASDGSIDPFGSSETFGQARETSTKIEVQTDAKGFMSQDEELDLAKGETHVEFALIKAPEISGLVLDPDGKPAPGSLVRLTPAMAMELPFDFFDTSMIFLSATVSDLEGKFRFKDFKSGGKKAQYRVIADHVLYSRGSSEPFGLKEKAGGDEPVDVQVTLVRGAKVRGLVTDGVKPVSGATVRLAKAQKKNGDADQLNMFMNMVGLPKGGDLATTGRDGKFEYTRVLPGEYVVTAEVVGFTDSPPQQLSIAAGDEKEVTLVVDPGGEIFGSVTDVNGNALASAKVRLFKEPAAGSEKGEETKLFEAQKFFGGSYKSVRTGEDGAFRIQGLPAATYAIAVELQGFVKREVIGISPGPMEQRVVLERASLLSGVVVDAASGFPLDHFRVLIDKAKTAETAIEKEIPDAFKAREYSDPEGRFLREDLGSGPHVVRVSAPGYTQTQKEIFLVAGARLEESFALEQAGRIRGFVVDVQTQQPIPGAKVRLLKSRGPLADSSTKESSGIESVSDKRRERSERRKADREAQKSGDAMQDDDAAMAAHFEEEWTPGSSTVTGEDGSFVIEDVPLGPQRVKVTHGNYVSSEQDGVEASVGTEAELSFALRAGLTLKGKVSDSAGKPAPNRLLYVRGVSKENEGLSKTALVGADGQFSVAGLEKGTYRIKVPAQPGKKVTSEPVTIEVTSFTTGVEVPVTEIDN